MANYSTVVINEVKNAVNYMEVDKLKAIVEKALLEALAREIRREIKFIEKNFPEYPI